MKEYIDREDVDAIIMRGVAMLKNFVVSDVVEVVRCKDCKHYRPENPVPSRNGKTKYCCRSAFVKVGEMDFCSYGERREDETN